MSLHWESSDLSPCSLQEVSGADESETVLKFDEAEEEGIEKAWADIANCGIQGDGEALMAGQRMTILEKKKSQVLLEGYVEVAVTDDEDDLTRTKSLTDDDLEELKGCLDLGFGFSYEEIPELCNTLPALELCYSMSQKFLDEQQNHHKSLESSSVDESSSQAAASPIANWKISSPGDNPDDVKARLKYWAQAVACTVKLCN